MITIAVPLPISDTEPHNAKKVCSGFRAKNAKIGKIGTPRQAAL